MNLENAYPRKPPEPKKKPRVLAAVLLGFLIFYALAALLVPKVSSHGDSKVASSKADIAVLCGAIEQFKLDCGRYPAFNEGLNSLHVQPNRLKRWRGPYLMKEISLDPWGNPHRYQCPGPSGKGYQVESYGADGQPGGTGDDADIIDGADS